MHIFKGKEVQIVQVGLGNAAHQLQKDTKSHTRPFVRFVCATHQTNAGLVQSGLLHIDVEQFEHRLVRQDIRKWHQEAERLGVARSRRERSEHTQNNR